MPLKVNLTIVPKTMAKEQTEAMKRRSDVPDGVVIEDKRKSKMGGEVEAATAAVDDEDPDAAAAAKEEAEQEMPEEEPKHHEEETEDLHASLASLDLEKSNKQEGSSANDGSQASLGKSMGCAELGKPSNEIGDTFYAMKIESNGKYSRKAELEDIARFAKVEKVDSDKLKEWLKSYLEQNFPEKLEIPNCIPRSAHIKDDVKKGFDAFGAYGWKPIKLTLQPGLIDISSQWTKEVVLEQFQLDYSTDLETALKEKGDKEVVSTLRKSPMEGHPLAVGLFKKNKKSEDTQVITEFRGMDSTVFQLGNNEGAAELDEETGDLVWKDVKKLRALLKDKPLPTKTGKGVSRTVDVLALESYMKGRVYYKASFTGSVSTDHGNEQYAGQRYWNWDLKYLLRYNGIPNAVVMYQDIELKFFSQVQYKMENEDWEWVNKGGSWVKQKLAGPA